MLEERERKGTVDDGWSPSINDGVTSFGDSPQSQLLLDLIALGGSLGSFKAKETMRVQKKRSTPTSGKGKKSQRRE